MDPITGDGVDLTATPVALSGVLQSVGLGPGPDVLVAGVTLDSRSVGRGKSVV